MCFIIMPMLISLKFLSLRPFTIPKVSSQKTTIFYIADTKATTKINEKIGRLSKKKKKLKIDKLKSIKKDCLGHI